mmetsp:Transcript_17304/g.34435  ORF Transcript_17304/g.34435 Transcript_17304/m.34435 type:complete len:219 (-) Transcript_17304:2309-2965(-)
MADHKGHPCLQVTNARRRCHDAHGILDEDCVREELLEKRCYAGLLCKRQAERFYRHPLDGGRRGGAATHSRIDTVGAPLLPGRVRLRGVRRGVQGGRRLCALVEVVAGRRRRRRRRRLRAEGVLGQARIAVDNVIVGDAHVGQGRLLVRQFPAAEDEPVVRQRGGRGRGLFGAGGGGGRCFVVCGQERAVREAAVLRGVRAVVSTLAARGIRQHLLPN